MSDDGCPEKGRFRVDWGESYVEATVPAKSRDELLRQLGIFASSGKDPKMVRHVDGDVYDLLNRDGSRWGRATLLTHGLGTANQTYRWLRMNQDG